MPRKQRSKKQTDEEESVEEIMEDRKKKKATKKKVRAEVESVEEQEDALSDIEFDDDKADQQQLAPLKMKNYKTINPETAIGELKADEILNYLISLGEETLNPGLRFGALSLLKQLTGRRRRNPYGSKRNNFRPPPQYSRHRGGPPNHRPYYPNNQIPLNKSFGRNNNVRGPITEDVDIYADN